MLIIIGKRHEGTNRVLEGFKTHTGDPIGAAFLKTNGTLTAGNEHRGQMRFDDIARLLEGEDALTFGRQTASIICDSGMEAVHDVMV